MSFKSRLAPDQQVRIARAIEQESQEPSDEEMLDIWQEKEIELKDQEIVEATSTTRGPDWYVALERNEWFKSITDSERSRVMDDYWLLDEVEIIIARLMTKRHSEYIHKAEILRFLRAFIESLISKPSRVLDPVSGYGDIAYLAGEASSAEFVTCLEAGLHQYKVCSELHTGRSSKIINTHFTDIADDSLGCYDLIITDAVPCSDKLAYCGCELSECELYGALLDLVSTHLAEGGKGMLVVDAFLYKRSNRSQLLNRLRDAELKISSIVYLGRSETSEAKSESYLMILEKGRQEQVIVGRMMPDPRHQNNLISNIHSRICKGDASLGRRVDMAEFTGFENIRYSETLQRLGRELNWSSFLGTDVFVDHEVIGPFSCEARLEQGPTSIYLNATGHLFADITADSFDTDCNQVIHLKVNPDLTSPSYLKYMINETAIGEVYLGSLQAASPFQRVYAGQLLSSRIYLPAASRQVQMLEGIHRIGQIRSEADELYIALLDGNQDLDLISDRICTINQEDHFLDWVDTLPFPLASILWRYQASQGSWRYRYEVLIDFFEATAAFMATIHLSAFMRDTERWSEARKGLQKKLSSHHLSLERATFGSWRITTEYLTSLSLNSFKKLSNSETGVKLTQNCYATKNRRNLEMICSRQILRVLQEANKLRNDWKGHSGAISEDRARLIHEQLRSLVEQVRSAFGRNWLNYRLIQPGEMKYKGGVYLIQAKVLMGARSSPFQEIMIEAKEPMERECLYLYDQIDRIGLKLLPLIDVVPSPEKETLACFIYSRLEHDSARWVSYHFEKESEIRHSPLGLDRLIAEIQRPGSI